jgi:hypothetical protein
MFYKYLLKLVFLELPALLIDAVTLGYAGAYSSLFSVKGRDFVKDTKKISNNYYSKP